MNIKKIKNLSNILILINLSILFSCADGNEEIKTNNDQIQSTKNNITPDQKLEKLYNELNNSITLSNNDNKQKFDKESIDELKNKLKGKDTKEKLEILKAIHNRNKKIEEIVNYKNKNSDDKNKKTGMIILNDNDSEMTILDEQKIKQLIGKHDESNLKELNETNEKLENIIKINKKIENLINEKAIKQIITDEKTNNEVKKTDISQIKHTENMGDIISGLSYNSTEEILNDIKTLKSYSQKTKLETLNLIYENQKLKKELKKNNYISYKYEYKNNKLVQIPINLDAIGIIEKILALKEGKKDKILENIKKELEKIIKANKSNLKKELYFSNVCLINYLVDGESSESFEGLYNKKDSKYKNYEEYIDEIIKGKHRISFEINEDGYTVFNQSSKIPKNANIDFKKYEKTIKFTVELLEKMYEINKEKIQAKYKKFTPDIDASTKENYIKSMLNKRGGFNRLQNISHIISRGILSKDNYLQILPIVQFLHKKGLDLTKKIKIKNENKLMKGTSFIDKAKEKGIIVNIDNGKVNMNI